MTPAEARAMADETIAFWRARGVRCVDVAAELRCEAKWRDVRRLMTAWLLSGQRRRSTYFRTAAEIADLIARARLGESWEIIGLALYPDGGRISVRTAACEMFRRHATDDDRRARAAAIRQRNFNKVPGLSRSADRRRRVAHIDDRPVLPPTRDPWAGMGDCFATRRAA